MKIIFRNLLSWLVLLFCFWQCANPMAPVGGPRDETPPRIDSLRSTPNLQTNFRPRTIQLAFDEWVKLQDANQQVIISPPLQGYTTKLKGKTVMVDLGEKDTLRTNVTYVIQFGNAVKDLTEGNVAENLRFVFSTGAFIDSLELQGQVVDAYTAEPVKDALVLLYENLADSVFRTQKPFYFGRTNEQGLFLISNIKAGQYRIAALIDADANYRFNQATEKIAFLASPIAIQSDSIPAIALRLFQEALPWQILDADTSQYGQVKLTLNQPPNDELLFSTDEPYLRTTSLDTLYFWHRSQRPWELRVAADTVFYDTLKVAAAAPELAAQQLDSLRLAKLAGAPAQNYPGQAYSLGFKRPIAQLDTSLILLRKDTFPERLSFAWEIDSTDQRRLLLAHSWGEKANYALEILPGGITDYWGLSNLDTLRSAWSISERKRFGNIFIQFNNALASDAYYLRLLVKGKAPVATFRLSGATSYTRQFNGLPPGEYQLEIIQDKNNNGRWDAGNYAKKQQPEQIVIKKIEALRANWDLEVEVALDTLFGSN